MAPKRKFYYAVARGRKAGIYETWEECELQTKGYSGARFKSFRTQEQAQTFLGPQQQQQQQQQQELSLPSPPSITTYKVEDEHSQQIQSTATTSAPSTSAPAIRNQNAKGSPATSTITSSISAINNPYSKNIDASSPKRGSTTPCSNTIPSPSVRSSTNNKNESSQQQTPSQRIVNPYAKQQPSRIRISTTTPPPASVFQPTTTPSAMLTMISTSVIQHPDHLANSASSPLGMQTPPAVQTTVANHETNEVMLSCSDSSRNTNTHTHTQAEELIITPIKKLNAKQAETLQSVKDGNNVFLTGPAGTGKTVVLEHVLQYCNQTYFPREWVAVAPTGTTAVAAGGQTIHSFAGIGIPMEQSDFERSWEPFKCHCWRQLKFMVIEEVSMISGEFLDRLNRVVCHIREDPRPFGGIQLLICGDFLQLPPIQVPYQDIRKMELAWKLAEKPRPLQDIHGNRGFAFQSTFWKQANLVTVELTEVFRQSNPRFVKILHEIRKGKVTLEAEAFLAKCRRPLLVKEGEVKPTRLYAKNADVNTENLMELDNLPGKRVKFEATEWVRVEAEAPEWAEEVLWNSDFFKKSVESELNLKVRAQVMLIKNDTSGDRGESRLVNGSRGVVVGFTSEEPDPAFNSPCVPPKPGERPLYPKVKFRSGQVKVIGFAEFTSRLAGIGDCVRVAIPLKLAWAITVHKSQGMSLDYVKIDLDGVFSKAQAYVALSRARDENSLELKNFSRKLVKADICALDFYDNPNTDIPTWDHRWKTDDKEDVTPPKARCWV
jgi:ATP-dependent DNA helicase PIF1